MIILIKLELCHYAILVYFININKWFQKFKLKLEEYLKNMHYNNNKKNNLQDHHK